MTTADVPVDQCPVDAPIQVVGGKWKLVLIFYLLQEPRRNGELRRLVPPITQKMLTQQLRELEADGIVTREVFDRVPPKVDYDIHPDERAPLEPLLQALCDWGFYWSDMTGARILALDYGTSRGAARSVVERNRQAVGASAYRR